MEKVLLSIVVASGLCAVSSHAARQFHFVNVWKNWTEAQSYCREHYTDLATIDNMEDMNSVYSLISLIIPGYSDEILKNMEPTNGHWPWIGLHRTDMYSWMWSLPNSSFYKHGEMEFRNWSTGESTGIGSGEYCGLMEDDGLWSDPSCSGLYKAVCCDVQGSNVTYHLTSNNMSWTEAQSFCRENYTDLVSVRNNAENEKVKELVPPGTGVWIGLFRDSWKWTDGSNSSFRFWREGQPSNNAGEDCGDAYFGDAGKWNDYPCNGTLPFICYNLTEGLAPKAPVMTRQVFKLHLRVEDGQDLDDEAMKDALLDQVKQRLKDQGLGHVKVSFRKQADGKFFTKEEKKKDEF